MPGQVEFLRDEPDEAAPHRAPRAPNRHLLLYRLGAALVVIAALGAWALTRPDADGGHPAEARATPSSSAAISPHPVPPPVVVCRLGAPVADEIVTAMLRYLPAIRVDNLHAYRCVRGSGVTGRVVFEAVTGRVGTLDVDVEATLRTGDSAGTNRSPHLGAGARRVLLSRAVALAAGLQVDVRAYGRTGQRAPVFAIRRLADFISLNVIL